jgi:sulfonate transport system substrate-binding protein
MGGDMPAITIAAVSDVLVTSLAKQGYTSFVSKGHLLIRDMRGKQIGYPYGSNAHYSLLQTLSSAGLRETDVDLIKLNVNEMAEALADGRIDMFVAWEPVPTVALDRYNDFTVIHRSLATSYLYFSGIFAKRNEELVRQIVAAQVRSMRWVNADRKNLIKACRWKLEREKELTGKEPVIPADETARLYKKGFLGIRRVPLIPEEDLLENGRLYREFHFLKNLGKIPDAGDWRRVRRSFNNSIIKEVVSHSEKYGLDEFSYRSDGSRDE